MKNVIELAREKAQQFEGEEMRELLARMIYNEYKMTAALNTIKLYLLFFVILTALSFIFAVMAASGVKF